MGRRCLFNPVQGNLVLLVAVLLCCDQLQYVSAAMQERLPSAMPAPLAVPEQPALAAPTAAQQQTAARPAVLPSTRAAAAPPGATGNANSATIPPGKPASKATPAAAPTTRKAAPAPAAAVTPTAAQGAAAKQPTPRRPAAAAPRAPGRPAAPTSTAAKARGSTKAAAVTGAAAAGAAAAAAAGKSSKSSVLDGLPPPIPLPLLLGESKYKNPQLSTDGRYLAYIKPALKTGVANVFVRKLPAPGDRPSQTEGYEDTMSIFDRDGTDNDRQITFDTKQGVSAYSWSEDSTGIFFIQDQDGDENYHLYVAPVTRPGDAVDLTPFPGVKAQGIVSNELFPSKLFIGLNRRDPSVFDMYSLDTATLTLTLDTINPGDVNNWLLDYDFNIRGAEGYNNTNGASYVLINDALPKVTDQTTAAKKRAEKLSGLRRRTPRGAPTQANVKSLEALFARAAKENWGFKQWVAASSSKADVSKWRRLITWPFGEDGGVFKFNKAGDGLFIITSIGRDTTEFQLISTAPGAKVLERIASNRWSNVNSVEFDPSTWEPQLVSFNYLKVQWTVLDESLKDEWRRIEAFRPDEEVSIVDRSFDKKVWILGYTSDSVNNKFYLYRPGSWPPELLFDTQPGLLPYTTAKMHGVVIPARDGLQLPAYLTLPMKPSIPTVLPRCVTGVVPDLSGQGRADVAAQRKAIAPQCPLKLNLPLVLAVHGGPWSRDTWGSDPVVQLLTNRGYAVLQVNYRASSGYGKRFMNLGDRQWGIGSMQHDLTDSVKWAVSKGIADPKKVCIMGGSYGGYATLAGLTFTPDVYACGVDLVGISNAGTFMRTIPPYWEPLRYEWLTRVGPADTDEAFNRRISPMYHVDKIKAPLFIAQGSHDPRVPQAESDQMFKAMHKRGLPVTYVLYTDEGHGIARPENRQDYYYRVESFLGKHLGGRVEPPVALEGVSAIVIKDLKDLEKVAQTAKKGGVADATPIDAGSRAKPRGV